MTIFEPVVIAILCDLLLGLIVYNSNRQRPANVGFLVLAVTIAMWLGTRQLAFLSTGNLALEAFWIRVCSVFGVLVPLAGALLRSTLLNQNQGWRVIRQRCRPWALWAAGVSFLCFTPFYLRSVKLPESNGGTSIPTAVWGPGNSVMLLYVLTSVGLTILFIWRDLRKDRVVGAPAIELQFVQTGYVVLLLGFFLSFWFKPRFFGPFSVLAFLTIIAYGITTRSILDVRTLARRFLSQAVLFAYACTVFGVTWWITQWVFTRVGANPVAVETRPALHSQAAILGQLKALLAAFAVALFVTPSRAGFQRLARRISPPQDLDFERTVTRVDDVIQTVISRRELLDGFSRVLREESHTDVIRVAIPDAAGGFKQFYPPAAAGGISFALPDHHPLTAAFRAPNPPVEITLEHLERDAPGPVRDPLLAALRGLGSDAVFPLRRRGGEISGLLVMGKRRGGRIFGRTGLGVLRVVADQLAVALDNSRLYSEAKRTAAYVGTLVENLTVGVVAAAEDGTLTIVNREAVRLFSVARAELKVAADLPAAAGRFVNMTLSERSSSRDRPVTLRPDTLAQADLLVSSLPFTFEDEDDFVPSSVNAILVLTDRTDLLRLERQVQQSERLASIGTLAAGMAHEVKNPLVALRVFTQLLPKRYDDPEFRASFHELVGAEIVRIENIVNGMLDFARPSRPALAPMRAHELIQAVLRFVAPQAARDGVELHTRFLASDDALTADRAKLQQVLLNLFINAVESFDRSRTDFRPRVEITTRLERGFPGDPNDPHAPPVFVTDVRDNGPGIPAEMIPHLFDPFFTTKPAGTGLGRSVSHTIVRDHGGFIEVYSEPGHGTRFSVRLPVSPLADGSSEFVPPEQDERNRHGSIPLPAPEAVESRPAGAVPV